MGIFRQIDSFGNTVANETAIHRKIAPFSFNDIVSSITNFKEQSTKASSSTPGWGSFIHS